MDTANKAQDEIYEVRHLLMGYDTARGSAEDLRDQLLAIIGERDDDQT